MRARLLLLLAGWGTACTGAPPPPTSAPPNSQVHGARGPSAAGSRGPRPGGSKVSDTVLITIETSRADRVGPLHPGARQTAPLLSARAATGRVYRRAYASSSWTLPSMVSIYTGLSPIEHTVDRIERQLPADVETLGDRLSVRGHQAAFFGVNPVFTVDRGLARGFEAWQAEVGWPAGQLNQAVLEWVDRERDPGRPLFLHVHYFDPHCPYIPAAGVAVVPDLVPSARQVPADRVDELGGCYGLEAADGTVERDVDVYLDRYDRELRAVDTAVDRLLTRLAERGIGGAEDRVVVTADHGEAFWEHDDYGHSHTLWAETTWVPLVVWDGHGAGAIDAPIGLFELFDGLTRPHDEPVLPLLAAAHRPVVQATSAGDRPWVGVIAGGRKWLSDGVSAWQTDPQHDPLDEALEPADPLRPPGPLEEARAAARPPVELTPSDEERDRLRALGYSL